jgi:predicted membrane metal-binding protein
LASAEPLRFVARAPRGGFGRVVKWLFWAVLLLPPLLMMGTCAGLHRFVVSEDEEVAMGAVMFGANALGLLWAVWLLGVPLLGVLMLLTRGRLLVIEQPPKA